MSDASAETTTPIDSRPSPHNPPGDAKRAPTAQPNPRPADPPPAQDSDPLPDGDLYRMYEGFLLAQDRHGQTATFRRIGFNRPTVTAVTPPRSIGAGTPGFEIATMDSITLDAFDAIVSTATVDDPDTGRQQTWMVRTTPDGVTVDRVAVVDDPTADQPTLAHTAYPVPQQWISQVAGLIQLRRGPRLALLTGAGADGIVVAALDTSTGSIAHQWTLAGSQPDTVTGSRLLTRNLDRWLFITQRSDTALTTTAVELAALSPATVTVDRYTVLPPIVISPDCDVDATVTTLDDTIASGQLLTAAAAPDGTPLLILHGFLGAQPTELSVTTVDTTFAPPRDQQFRLTSADLDNNGQQEAVLAYATDYGGTAGAVAFVLVRYSADSRRLESISTYVAAAPRGAPLASKGLRLGAGILGDAITAGVLVLSAGGDLAHILRGEVQVFAGILPVNPVTSRFPDYTEKPATLPNITQIATTGLNAETIWGSTADLLGLSVTLGKPTVTQRSGRGQLLAVLQVAPYQQDEMVQMPSLTFSETGTDVAGLSVTTSRDWMMSVDAGLNVGIDPATLTTQAGNSYGTNFSKMDDSTFTRSVEISRTPTLFDRLVTIGTDYTIWRYPVLRRSRGSQADGFMLVIFPDSAIAAQNTPIAYDRQFGYRTPFEPGAVLTYMNTDLDGWDDTLQGSLLLFDTLVSLQVSNDLPDTNDYNKSDANIRTVGENFYVAATTGTSANLLRQTSLFSYLPASFGFHLSTSETYSETQMTTTSVSRTKALTISVSGGSISNQSLRYTVTPYIYQHASLGATVIAYRVSNLGPGWHDRYADPYPRLILPFRNQSDNNLERTFSRSISFTQQSADSVVIIVEVFNEGFTDADLVTAQVFLGEPTFDGTNPVIPPITDLIGTVTGQVPALGRRQLRIPWRPTVTPTAVTAVVWGGKRTYDFSEIAWNTYPESAFADLDLLTRLDDE